MTYGIKIFGMWNDRYWKEEFKNDDKIISIYNYEYTDLNEKIFYDTLKDELNIPEFQITKKNIIAEFGSGKEKNEISEACINQIIKYYKWRKALYDKICKLLKNNGAETLLKTTQCDKLTLTYNIPAEYNNFSFEEAPYTGGQVSAHIKITLYK